MHGLCWRCEEAGWGPWPAPLATGYPLPAEPAKPLPSKWGVKRKVWGLGFFFLLS